MGRQAALEAIRRFDTAKGITVELRMGNEPGYEYSCPGEPITYAIMGYCVFLPKQRVVVAPDSETGVCGAEHQRACGQTCLQSEDRLGGVCVSAKRMGDYDINYLKDALSERGVVEDDIVSTIEIFFPVHPTGLRKMGIGGGVLGEVLNDCHRAGSAAVYCGTIEREMMLLLRNRKFGFEEIRPFIGEFVNVFEEKPTNPKFRSMGGLIVRTSK